jgi:hypothetical protein
VKIKSSCLALFSIWKLTKRGYWTSAQNYSRSVVIEIALARANLNAREMRQQTVSLDHAIESTSITWRSLRKKRETLCSDKYILRLKNYIYIYIIYPLSRWMIAVGLQGRRVAVLQAFSFLARDPLLLCSFHSIANRSFKSFSQSGRFPNFPPSMRILCKRHYI